MNSCAGACGVGPAPERLPGLTGRNWVARLACSLALAYALALTVLATAPSNSSPPVSTGRDQLPLAFRKSAPSSLEDLRAMEKHLKGVVSRVSPAVVAVQVGAGAGSGVVVTADGLVLCAAHVCGEPDQDVLFTFPDGRTAVGKTLGTNHERDSALMRITDPGPWPHADLASAGSLRQGDWVVALGHPGGFDPNRAVVARLGRVIRLGLLMQTDCTLMGGDSGGPLFDMHGRVVAIHSRISESTTENFHVPIETYLETWTRLVKGEFWGEERPAPQATIGVRGIDGPGGCRLESLNPEGPASRAGLRVGDIVLRVGTEPVRDAESLVRLVRRSSPGEEIMLVVARDGTEVPVKVRVEARRSRGMR